MRDAFFAALTDRFRADPRVVFITADLGYTLFEAMRTHDRRRVINVGVRENAMVMLAAGLAREGYRPVVYTFANFLALRSLEFIWLDAVLPGLPVLFVGIGGGMAYGHDGPTHFAVNDCAALTALPGLAVYVPADPAEAAHAVHRCLALPGPSYLRLEKNGELPLPCRCVGAEDLDRPLVLRAGGDVALCVMGSLATVALAATERLAADGIAAGVIRIARLAPFSGAALGELVDGCRLVLTLEEHVAAGGLGDAVARHFAARGCGPRLEIMAVPPAAARESGSRDFLRGLAGLDAAAVAARCARAYADIR